MEQETAQMSHLTDDEVARLAVTRTIDEDINILLAVLERMSQPIPGQMPQPVRLVVGPLSSGKRTPEENRKRLKRTIFHYKEIGVVTFNYLPFQRRALQIMSDVPKEKLQERLRDEFYAPILKSGKITELYIMPDSDASLNVHWMRGFAAAKGIPIRFIPKEMVPK